MSRTKPMIRTPIIVLLVLCSPLVSSLGCGKDDAHCEKACENVTHITLENLDKKVGPQPGDTKTGSGMSPEGAQRIYSQVKSDCIEACEERGATKKLTDCFQAATNMDEVAACR